MFLDLSESFQPNSYPLLLCENFGSHAGTPELSLEQMLPLGEAVVLVERGHLLLPGCQPPSFLRVRGCLPSRQAVGSQSPPGSCRAGGGSPDFPQGAAAHKHSLASLWKLPECLPLSPHSGPRRPVWPSEEGCPCPRTVCRRGQEGQGHWLWSPGKSHSHRSAGGLPPCSLYLSKYLSTECSGWCFLYINLYSNCSSFDRKNRAHFIMLSP